MKKREKDMTPHKCGMCDQIVPASGMPSHLYHKHDKISSEDYVSKFGEFRSKWLKKDKLLKEAGDSYKCLECDFTAQSHKQLVQHISTKHKSWEQYYIKHYFNGKWPTCKCGCGKKMALIKSGKDESGKKTYARSYLPGHNSRTNLPGYRTNSYDQRMNMRKAAISRLERGDSTFHQSGPSKNEQEIADYIKNLGVEILQGDKDLLSGLEIDILIPSFNIGIEYNGTYFHSEQFKQKKYHLNKTEEALKNGYRLIHIWEPDWYNKSEILKSMISQILHKTSKTIYARHTEVREISRELCSEFLSKNHLQGTVVGNVYLGLFHQSELISVMSFSKLRKATGMRHEEGSYELLRFCSKLHTNVIGAASKLFSYFKNNYSPKKVVTYANRDWSVGNLYEKIGMKFEGNTTPGYFYVKSKIKYSRFQFQKHKLIEQGEDPTLTEYEIMLGRGYSRVWDCGNLKYVWTPNV